jgi:hypothetical protein
MFSRNLFFENYTAYEKYDTARQVAGDSLIRHTCFAWWKIKATDKHIEYVTFIALPRQVWLHERASILRL